MVEMLREALDAGNDNELAFGIFLGLLGSLFVALMWLRVWRWFFALMGLRA